MGCEHVEFAAMDQRLGVREIGALRGVSTRANFERLGYAGS
jgi:hypothetical protein